MARPQFEEHPVFPFVEHGLRYLHIPDQQYYRVGRTAPVLLLGPSDDTGTHYGRDRACDACRLGITHSNGYHDAQISRAVHSMSTRRYDPETQTLNITFVEDPALPDDYSQLPPHERRQR